MSSDTLEHVAGLSRLDLLDLNECSIQWQIGTNDREFHSKSFVLRDKKIRLGT